jgi:conjugal transfer/entry exclusion protein
MKRHSKILIFVFCLCLATNTHAQGILTYDPADVAQSTIAAQEAIKQTQQQLQQY